MSAHVLLSVTVAKKVLGQQRRVQTVIIHTVEFGFRLVGKDVDAEQITDAVIPDMPIGGCAEHAVRIIDRRAPDRGIQCLRQWFMDAC